MKLINAKYIRTFNPCSERIESFERTHPKFNGTIIEFLSLQDLPYSDKIWVACKVVDYKILQMWSVLCAESVLPNYKKQFPHDNTLEEVFVTIKKVLSGELPSSAARSAERSAARSAASAARSAEWSAESAARSAEWSAESAERGAESAARSAAWSAESAAWSAVRSATRSAESAARSAAWSAESAARSAASAARSAASAESAAWSAESAARSAASAAEKEQEYLNITILITLLEK